ncbi:pre-mRNA-splicing factor Slu7p [[Candida] anglica]|uniref:Pre-mRNA-splicing factor SLU7 n=1 Tax=[Candida] anglica TaxID=148631 RepID=A0ABP0ENV3_9ASCO
MSSSGNPDKTNEYIPKFISKVPWYHQTETGDTDSNESNTAEVDHLAHQRADPTAEQQDHSLPVAGQGVKDEFVSIEGGNVHIRKDTQDWDAKRDRWHGFESSEWDKVAQNWDNIKRNSRTKQQNKKSSTINLTKDNDSDDTDYELELQELGLTSKDITSNSKEDPMEKILRDRQDVPSYILSISANANGKIKYDPKSRATMVDGTINEDSQFVRSLNGEGLEVKKLQSFAWEASEAAAQIEQQKILERRLQGELIDVDIPAVDLNLNLQANPTAMMLRARKVNEEKEKEKLEKRQKLAARYG